MQKIKIILEDLAKKIDGLATKEGVGKLVSKLATKEEVENLAIITKQGFDNVDFKFLIVNEQIRETNSRLNNLEKKVDKTHDEVIKNGDAFARLKNYVDAETTAVHGHLLRVDEKIGLV